eukprot:TRINITY_DN5471_c0_g1_i7.p1 TRINITY_DN5471_c0_g1~~TRINITY_DN5471_c0_g1_i7.p1  ORF type:complete len:163 (-),score=28.04 TRINITY_DN5471_c0_g1_i7:625-1113(-)
MNLLMPFKLWTIPAVLASNYWCMGKPVGKLSVADWLRFGFMRTLFLIIRYAPGFERIMSFLLLLVMKILPPPSSSTPICPRTGALAKSPSATCPSGSQPAEPSLDWKFLLGIRLLVVFAMLLHLVYGVVFACLVGGVALMAGQLLVHVHGIITCWMFHQIQQ